MKDTLTEMENNLQGIKMKLRIISVIWNMYIKKKEAKPTQSEQQKEKRIKNKQNKDSVRILWDNFKCTNIHIMGMPEGEKREQDTENLFERAITENFPNLVKNIDIQDQEAQKVPNKMNPKRPTPIHIIIKMQKVKDK